MPQCNKCKSEVPAGARFCAACGSLVLRRPDSKDPFIGQTVADKYLIEQLLGTGGMGRVYKARHRTLDRAFVIKILNRDLLSDPSIAERFEREALAASRLNHPNSISIIDFGSSEDGTLYIVMEHVPGRNLAKLLAQEFPLAQRRVVRIVSQILGALADAHAAGIVHRDLKPENVMVEARRDEPDFVKVLDFGIAKLNDSGGDVEQKLTRTGMVCGTPGYMSPEQARGEELDPRSDLYSVAVMMYELLTGRLAFEGTTPMALVNKHMFEQPIPPRERRPELDISPDLDALVMRALAKDKDQRPASAEEMRADLLACAVPHTTPSRPVPAHTTVILPVEGAAAAVPRPADRPVATPSPAQRIRLLTPPGADRPVTPSRQRAPTPKPPSDRERPAARAASGSSPVAQPRVEHDGPEDEREQDELETPGGGELPPARKLPIKLIAGGGAAAILAAAVVVLLITQPWITPAAPPPPARVLVVELKGDGAGTVMDGNGLKLSCSRATEAQCRVAVDGATPARVVKLVASPDSKSTFSGWLGACSGDSDCTVAMDANRRVIATFAQKAPPPPPSVKLTVEVGGDGAGTVTGDSDLKLNCSRADATACTADFAPATPARTVKLVAKPASGSKFAGWSGACSGEQGTCRVSMEASQAIGARFEMKERPEAPVIQAVCYGLNCMASPPKSSGAGIISVDATPWAYVSVNGRRVGNKETPLEARIAEGSYKLSARHPEL
ncbi:MAG TPA: protein kinase, partial [Myxococcaceae bacterium]|nr:protein kinase [Myxococcaceae bacterium]